MPVHEYNIVKEDNGTGSGSTAARWKRVVSATRKVKQHGFDSMPNRGGIKMVEAEEAAMEIIVNADESRSLCLEALQAARHGQVEQANALMTRADKFARLAHQVQTKLAARETVMPMTSIMAHAQDHLMTSLLVRELANEMLYLYQR